MKSEITIDSTITSGIIPLNTSLTDAKDSIAGEEHIETKHKSTTGVFLKGMWLGMLFGYSIAYIFL